MDKIKEFFSKDNKIMGVHPVLIVILLLIGSIFLVQRFGFFSDENLPQANPAPPEVSEGNIVTESFSKLKNMIPFIKESETVENAPEKIQPISLNPLPNVPSNEPEINEELLNNASKVENKGFKLENVDLRSIGRRDPMKPVYVNNVEDLEMYDKEFLFYSTEDDEYFYLITEEILGSNGDEVIAEVNDADVVDQDDGILEDENVPEDENIPEEEKEDEVELKSIIKYKTWEDAISSGKKPSIKAQQYNIDMIKKQTLNSELIDESIDYFKGLTPNRVVVKYVYLDEEQKPVANFYGVGGEFEEIGEGEYLAGIYYIEDINIELKSVTLSFKYGDLLVKKMFSRKALYEKAPNK